MTDHDTPMPRHHEEDEADRQADANTEFGGAYGDDDTPMPTETAETLGDPPRGEARYDTSFERASDVEDDHDRADGARVEGR